MVESNIMDFTSTRPDSSHLPAVLEIEAILEREAKRPFPPGKESSHFADFSLAIEWLTALGLPTDGFTSDLPWQDLAVSNLDLPNQVAEAMLARPDDAQLDDIARRITGYLGEEDEPQPSDAIFVFGSKSIKRMETAVELYKCGIAPRIFVTGGMPIYEKREEAEAQVYKRWAMEQGVPEKVLFTHDTAIGIADNVRGGLNEMDALGLPYASLVLVTAWFAQRRSFAHMMKYIPETTRLYRVNAPVTVGGDYDPHLWWKNASGIKVVFNEFAKLRLSEALNSS